jgi:hypothetical protein
LVLIVPGTLCLGFGLGVVLALWDRAGDADLYGSPEDPFRQFPE